MGTPVSMAPPSPDTASAIQPYGAVSEEEAAGYVDAEPYQISYRWDAIRKLIQHERYSRYYEGSQYGIRDFGTSIQHSTPAASFITNPHYQITYRWDAIRRLTAHGSGQRLPQDHATGGRPQYFGIHDFGSCMPNPRL